MQEKAQMLDEHSGLVALAVCMEMARTAISR